MLVQASVVAVVAPPPSPSYVTTTGGSHLGGDHHIHPDLRAAPVLVGPPVSSRTLGTPVDESGVAAGGKPPRQGLHELATVRGRGN